ncbi:MAG: GIY-YIG nuclease family protein [Thermomicrobiales bacterium]
MNTYYVYIMASASRTIYIGMTNNLERRVWQHKAGTIDGFSRKYRTSRLVYIEDFGDVRDAIAREKQLKGWLRARKIALIEERNPRWNDLAWNWYGGEHS